MDSAVDEIYADLTARRDSGGTDLTQSPDVCLRTAGVAFKGDTKGGPFDVAG